MTKKKLSEREEKFNDFHTQTEYLDFFLSAGEFLIFFPTSRLHGKRLTDGLSF
jgi:hypothetical protein